MPFIKVKRSGKKEMEPTVRIDQPCSIFLENNEAICAKVKLICHYWTQWIRLGSLLFTEDFTEGCARSNTHLLLLKTRTDVRVVAHKARRVTFHLKIAADHPKD